jgi:hypothetical protein
MASCTLQYEVQVSEPTEPRVACRELCCRGFTLEGANPECCNTTCSLIEACLSSDIGARPTAAQLVAALEGLQGDAAEPGSRPMSAQLVAALGQLQMDAAGLRSHLPSAQLPDDATDSGSQPVDEELDLGQQHESASRQQPADATTLGQMV